MKKDYTIEERAVFLEGKDGWQTHKTKEGLSLVMTDGPHGLRKQLNFSDSLGLDGSFKAVCYPTASLLACSFDPNLTYKMAKLIAKEAKAAGVNIVLGPGVNIKRSPLCGRNFEYFSEDPILTARMAESYVEGLESENVGASIKHFCCNNQETLRYNVDVVVDERTLNEIYLKAFLETIRKKPATIMASYNKINGYYATEHPYLHSLLREKYKYEGLLISDWGAISNRVNAARYGCDLEMPTTDAYNTAKLIHETKISEAIRQAVIDSSNRVIKTINKYQIKDVQDIDYNKHHEEARELASQSMVLLKNDKILPLNPEEKVLFIGALGKDFRYQGAGSSYVNSYLVESFDKLLEGSDDFILGYTLEGDGHCEELYNEAIYKARLYDKIVFLLGLPEEYEAEGFDRKSLNLPSGQIKLLKGLLEVNPNIVSVVLAGSVVNLSEVNYSKGLLMAYLSGEAGALAIMDILYGDKNPSGRLAETFIADIKDSNIKITNHDRAFYDEAIYVGYRYYNTFEKEVIYPFGYGLSYTNFSYRAFKVSSQIMAKELIVEVKVKNTGSFDGAEVIQLYIENNISSVYKAKRELRQFKKVFLKVGEEQDVSFTLTKEDFNYYDINIKDFTYNTGEYKIQLAHNVEEIICEEFVVIVDEDPRFVEHEKTSYNKKQYDTSDFTKIYQNPLPSRRIRRRPFSLDSNLKNLRYSLLGLIIGFIIIKMANKAVKDIQARRIIKKSLLTTPIRTIAVMSDGRLPLATAEGLIDICNFHLIRGIKKIIKGNKKNENEVV